MSRISGLVCVRNPTSLDYCYREAVYSLIPVCQEVVLCDGSSDDGSRESIEAFAATDSRIRLITYPWPNPHNNPYFWVEWLQWARAHLKCPLMLSLDADEVLCESSYPAILKLAENGHAAMFQRLNFWGDAKHLAPENRCCGTMVARMGPTNLYLPSDEPIPRVSPNIRDVAQYRPDLLIFHYGFIREPKAFVKKSVAVQNMFMGSCDRRITDTDAAGKDWRECEYFDGEPLREFFGSHPAVAHSWLKARGYSL